MLLDSDNEDPPGVVVAPKHMSSALGSLMANYGSMTESDSEPEGELLAPLCL